MPATKDDLVRFHDMLESHTPEYWRMIRKQYRRYLDGEMPAEFAWLLDRPELIVALFEDSVLYRERARKGEAPGDE